MSSAMLRVVGGHNSRNISYINLHKNYNRATPSMWSKYTTAVAMWDLINNGAPEFTVLSAMLNRQYDARRNGMIFTRSNKTRIGFNCLSNRLQCVTKQLKMNWQDMTKKEFKLLCKKTFINEELKKNRN